MKKNLKTTAISIILKAGEVSKKEYKNFKDACETYIEHSKK